MSSKKPIGEYYKNVYAHERQRWVLFEIFDT